jgi:hypothetical protein
MSTFTLALRAELASLEEELRNDPRHAKIEKIKSLLGDYGADVVDTATAPLMSAAAPAQSKNWRGVPRENSKATRARLALRDYMLPRGAVSRDDLLQELTRLGIVGREQFPMRQVSTYLSRFPEFESAGGGNWRYNESHSPQTTEPSGDLLREGDRQTAQ